jgi:hypothetical protein
MQTLSNNDLLNSIQKFKQ